MELNQVSQELQLSDEQNVFGEILKQFLAATRAVLVELYQVRLVLQHLQFVADVS